MSSQKNTLSDTALDIDSLLAAVEDHLHCLVGSDTDAARNQGLVLVVERARANARELYDNLDHLEYWQRLTASQRDTVGFLIRNIAEGDVNPNQVSGKDSPRIALARFQAEAEKLNAEQCAKEFARGEYNVGLNMTPEVPGDSYIVSKEWTLKGLRHDLAERRFMDSITCNVDQDRWEVGNG